MSPAANTPSPIPHRSAKQRAQALAEANRIRSLRAELKRGLADGTLDPIVVLRVHADDLATMRVEAFLCALRWIGRERARRILLGIRVAPSKTIGGLTPRQAADLRWAVDRYARSSADARSVEVRP